MPRSRDRDECGGTAPRASRLRRVLHAVANTSGASTRTRHARARSHRRQPVASSPFQKSAVCTTVTTASPRSRCAASIQLQPTVPPVRSTRLRCGGLLPMSAIFETVVRHPRWRLRNGVSCPHFDFSVGTGDLTGCWPSRLAPSVSAERPSELAPEGHEGQQGRAKPQPEREECDDQDGSHWRPPTAKCRPKGEGQGCSRRLDRLPLAARALTGDYCGNPELPWWKG